MNTTMMDQKNHNSSSSMASRDELNRKILAKQRCKSNQRTALLWTLFLYGLLQIAANLPSDNSSHLLKLQEAPTIKTVIDSSLNEELPSDGCNRGQRQQLCSSAAAATTITESSQEGRDEASLIKSTRPLFLSSSSSSLPSVIHSSLLQIFKNLSPSNYIINVPKRLRSLLGPNILLAEAASLYQPNQEKGIIVLNSTNFNSELIQNRNPFPHLKLIEFYVSFCGFCGKFKATYTKLAKDIYSWRNIIRPSVIDVGVSSNVPIAQSWRVDTVPTIRILPPIGEPLASKIDKQLSKKMNDEKSNLDDSQKYLFTEYNNSKPMMHQLEPHTYMDNVPQFKNDLIEYINSYVRSDKLNYIPETWPNLRPVSESKFSELLSNHPRQELFLLIQGPSASDQSSQSNLGLQVMLELSSKAPWKAIRYVKASENKALVEDVIAQLKKSSGQPIDHIDEQVEILNDFLMDKSPAPGKGNIVLVHTDDSHPLVKSEGSSFSFITAMTGQNLLNAEQVSERGRNNRVRRAINHDRQRRSVSSLENLSSDRQAELIANHIAHTYTETIEDRKFVRAINDIYRDISTGSEDIQEDLNKDTSTNNDHHQSSAYKKASNRNEDSNESEDSKESIFTQIYNLFNAKDSNESDSPSAAKYSQSESGDYYDKIKAIRYILFNEVPRTSFADKSLAEQQEKLSVLLNLVSVIKSYFPLSDSSSIQFMDGVHNYLLKQQSKLLSVNNRDERGSLGFDTRAFKQELKRLESEDKRLPEVKEYKHCAKWGYPCALWRLFHTLTAFEYKKLNQIRLIPQTSTGLQPQQQHQQQQPLLTGASSGSNAAPAAEAGAVSLSKPSINSNDVPSPVERLVSPPSTTTSLSLTIVGPSTSSSGNGNSNNNNINSQKPMTEADLPTPVLLVMRDYVTNFFGCTDCAKNFRQESADLSLERIRQQEPAEFSILWLWETHNRVNKRLSVDPVTNPPDHPKLWFPSYEQCKKCYKKPPSFLRDETILSKDAATIFHESIEWNRQEILSFLVCEYTKQPMDDYSSNLFAHNLPHGFVYIIAACTSCLILIMVIRCTTQYAERQRRQKATLLNGSNAHYSLELR